jgi:leucyl-tRNA synthetase
MWEKTGHDEMLVFQPWPVADKSKLAKTSQTLAVSVNGKHRGEVALAADAGQDAIIAAAKEAASKFLTGEIVKTVFVPGRMVNFVIR